MNGINLIRYSGSLHFSFHCIISYRHIRDKIETFSKRGSIYHDTVCYTLIYVWSITKGMEKWENDFVEGRTSARKLLTLASEIL